MKAGLRLAAIASAALVVLGGIVTAVDGFDAIDRVMFWQWEGNAMAADLTTKIQVVQVNTDENRVWILQQQKQEALRRIDDIQLTRAKTIANGDPVPKWFDDNERDLNDTIRQIDAKICLILGTPCR